jgi:methylated-DNA-protein-cysteine methyltransferase-like protein
VLSYGAVAALAGSPRAARGVGAALSAASPELDLPWWRVINASGRITTPRVFHIARLQRALLAEEGVPLGTSGQVDMDRFAWVPEPSELIALQ